MKVNSLPWDSAFFNLRVGELIIDNNEGNNIENQDDFDLIYVKAPVKSNISISHFICSYTETKILFEKKRIKKNEKLDKNIESIFSTDFDLKDLYNLALVSGEYSRFKLDQKFSKKNFRNLFNTWINNSLSKKIADGFFVYKLMDKTVGFVTYGINENFGIIGLVGVNPNQQGKGIGSQLIRAVENELLKNGINSLRIPTQLKNKEACNFYQKLGYSPIEKIELKHFWRDSIQ
jgi:dTDP-4-amino-4,6-dideoxy-D-galactose acyltransferase